MIDLSSVNWSALSDGDMAKLHVETRAAGTGRVICDETVLYPKDFKGIINGDLLGAWHQSVAFGERPQASSADRLAAAIAVLATADDMQAAVRAQAVVSDILLRHPAVLDPSYLVPMGDRFQSGVATVTTALALTSVGAMPSSMGGHDDRQLKDFAGHPSLRRAFFGPAPKRAWMVSRRYGGLVRVEKPGSFMSNANSIRPSFRFLASVLDLEHRVGRRIFGTGSQVETGKMCIEHAIVRSLALHHLVGIEMKMRQPSDVLIDGLDKFDVGERFRVEPLCALLSRSAVIEVFPAFSPSLVQLAHVAHNCRAVLDAMVKLRLAADRCSAAQLLYTHTLDGKEPLETHDSGAMGFMKAMDEAGYQVPQRIQEPANMKSAPVRANYQRWAAAHSVVAAKQAMTRVIAVDALQAQPVPGAAPRRLRAV